MSKKRIMIIDSGSRGHATADFLRKNSPEVGDIFVAPGNGGTNLVERAWNIKLDPMHNGEVVNAAKSKNIDMVIIAPERPLANGVVDALSKEGIIAFGPTKKAAKIEWSKSWMMQLLKDNNIPHPEYAVFNNEQKAHAFIDNPPFWGKKGLVIKADGLADGKGVVVARNAKKAHEAVSKMMKEKVFGLAGAKIIIQELLIGVEVSAQAITDGKKYLMLLYGEDHKQAYDGDKGPMTGGMGVRVPHPLVTAALSSKIESLVIKPIISAMRKQNISFRGVLYPGLFITDRGDIKVIEGNSRPGGPEWETVLRLLESNLYQVLWSAANGNLGDIKLRFSDKTSLSVVLASKGYPKKYVVGKKISGLPLVNDKDVVVYHAGTKKRENGVYETSGGRVLLVTGVGNNFKEAYDKTYKSIGKINFQGKHHRTDIGSRR